MPQAADLEEVGSYTGPLGFFLEGFKDFQGSGGPAAGG
jgi:hypothetical protein